MLDSLSSRNIRFVPDNVDFSRLLGPSSTVVAYPHSVAASPSVSSMSGQRITPTSRSKLPHEPCTYTDVCKDTDVTTYSRLARVAGAVATGVKISTRNVLASTSSGIKANPSRPPESCSTLLVHRAKHRPSLSLVRFVIPNGQTTVGSNQQTRTHNGYLARLTLMYGTSLSLRLRTL